MEIRDVKFEIVNRLLETATTITEQDQAAETQTEVTYDEIQQLVPVLSKLIKTAFNKIKTGIKQKKDNQTYHWPILNTLISSFKSYGFRAFLDVTQLKFGDIPGRFRPISFLARNSFIFMRTMLFNRKLGRVFGEHNDILRSVTYMAGFAYMTSYGTAEVMHKLMNHRTELENIDQVEDALEYTYGKFIPDLLDMFVKYGMNSGVILMLKDMESREINPETAARTLEKLITGFVSALTYAIMHYGYGVYTGALKIQQVEPSNRFIAWSKLIRRADLY